MPKSKRRTAIARRSRRMAGWDQSTKGKAYNKQYNPSRLKQRVRKSRKRR